MIDCTENSEVGNILSQNNYRFLVAEDNPTMLKMILTMLGSLGINDVESAMDGREAWDKLQADEKGIDIVLSDFLMPKLDGLQLRFWNMPFVMITSVDDREQIMSATEEEIDYYIVKPVTPNKLEECLKSVLKKKYDPDPYHRRVLREPPGTLSSNLPAARK